MATKAPTTVEPNPLAEGMTKVTGIDPLSTSTGTSPIGYSDDAGFRAPEGDIITISGDPGTGATQAETWGHELELAQQEFEALQFEYSQQQDLLSQELAAQQLALDEQAAALAQSQYGLSAASGQREATASEDAHTAAAIANSIAAYDLQKLQREEQFRNDYYAAAAKTYESSPSYKQYQQDNPFPAGSQYASMYNKDRTPYGGTYTPGTPASYVPIGAYAGNYGSA